MCQPRLKLGRRFGDDEEAHVRVLMSAELSALSAERAFLIRLDPERVLVTGNEVALAVEVRCPETVDHIL